jgi:hypothetical protein
MQQITSTGQNIVSDLARRYNLSQDAVIHMLIAVNNGGGSMAQFNCPELGGNGQWMRGGMTMVGDMFNYGLKMTVDNLCAELSNVLATTEIFPPAPLGSINSNQWWPASLGNPFSSGAQNNIRYAVFPQTLAVALNGQVTVYDTLGHHISGVSQQQGGDSALTFSSQYGTVSVSSLPIVSGAGLPQAPHTNFATPADALNHSNTNIEIAPSTPLNQMTDQRSKDDIIALIGNLAQLRDVGALTEAEFNSKKIELLNRL